MIFAASMGLSTLQGLWQARESVDRIVHNGVDSDLEAALGSIESREIIGPTVSHNRHTQCFLRHPISLVPNPHDLQD